MEPQVRYVKTEDRSSVPYAVTGKGLSGDHRDKHAFKGIFEPQNVFAVRTAE